MFILRDVYTLRDESMVERLRWCDLSSCLSSLLEPAEEHGYIQSLNTCHTCWHQAALSARVWIYRSAAGHAGSCCLCSRKTVCAWCQSFVRFPFISVRGHFGASRVCDSIVGGGGGEGGGRDVEEMIVWGFKTELTFMAPVQARLAAAWGAFHRPEQNLRGQQDLHLGCKKGVIANGSNMPFNTNGIIYGSQAVWDLSLWEGQQKNVFTQGKNVAL